MSFQIENNGRSFYKPNALFIKFRPEYLDENGYPVNDKVPVFFHEYAHLIQDVATCYGMIDFILFTYIIEDVVKYIKNDKIRGIPYKKHSEFNNSKANIVFKFRSCTYPQTKWENGPIWAFKEWKEPECSEVTYLEEKFLAKTCMAVFIDNATGEELVHTLGVREIKESYAMAIQNIHQGCDYKYEEGVESQYFVVERIILKEFGEVTNQFIVVVCHWALQDEHPCENFIEIIDYLKNSDTNICDVHQINLELKKRFIENHLNCVTKIKNKFEQILTRQARSGEADLLFCVYRWYINNAIQKLDDLVDLNNNFPLGLKFTDPAKSLEDLLEKYPIYMYEGSDGYCYMAGKLSQHESQYVYFLRSMVDLVEQISVGSADKWPCIWYHTCNEDIVKFKDKICEQHPWKKADFRPACPYAAACAYLGIGEKTQFYIFGEDI